MELELFVRIYTLKHVYSVVYLCFVCCSSRQVLLRSPAQPHQPCKAKNSWRIIPSSCPTCQFRCPCGNINISTPQGYKATSHTQRHHMGLSWQETMGHYRSHRIFTEWFEKRTHSPHRINCDTQEQ